MKRLPFILCAVLLFAAFAACAFAGKYKVLQVEYADGANFSPDVPHTKLQAVSAEFLGVSGHASIVANNLTGPASPARELIGELIVCEAVHYLYRQMGVPYASTAAYPVPRNYQGWVVENHSYGLKDMYLQPPGRTPFWQCMADRVNRDNVVVVVAVPDRGFGWREGQWLGYWNWSDDVIRVGSSTGNIDLNDKYPADPHLVAEDDIPSYGSPKVAAAAVCVIDVFKTAGKAYAAADIRAILVSTCDWLPSFGDRNDPKARRIYGAGKLNLPKALEEARRRVAGNSPPPAPVEKVTVKRTGWQEAKVLLAKNWTLVPTKNGGADLVDPQGVRRFYLTSDSLRLLNLQNK